MDFSHLPLATYRSHKIVRAARIAAVYPEDSGFSKIIVLEGDGELTIPAAELVNKPIPAAGMWLVVYNDGYFSFSPGDKFEEGYLLAEDPRTEVLAKRIYEAIRVGAQEGYGIAGQTPPRWVEGGNSRMQDEARRTALECETIIYGSGHSPNKLLARIADLQELLQSAHAIARRNGANTHWGRWSDRLADAGIGSVTAKTFQLLPSDDAAPPTFEARLIVEERELADREGKLRVFLDTEKAKTLNPQILRLMQDQRRYMTDYLWTLRTRMIALGVHGPFFTPTQTNGDTKPRQWDGPNLQPVVWLAETGELTSPQYITLMPVDGLFALGEPGDVDAAFRMADAVQARNLADAWGKMFNVEFRISSHEAAKFGQPVPDAMAGKVWHDGLNQPTNHQPSMLDDPTTATAVDKLLMSGDGVQLRETAEGKPYFEPAPQSAAALSRSELALLNKRLGLSDLNQDELLGLLRAMNGNEPPKVEDFHGHPRVLLLTKKREYSIRWRVPDAEMSKGYLGCVMSLREPLPGEIHIRGRDLPDGGFSTETWQRIVEQIAATEAYPEPAEMLAPARRIDEQHLVGVSDCGAFGCVLPKNHDGQHSNNAGQKWSQSPAATEA